MPFSPDELARIQATVGALVARRQPPAHLRDRLRFELEIVGHRVRIHELHDDQDTQLEVAQLTFTRTDGTWTLYWTRASGRREIWPPSAHITALEPLVAILDQDDHGAFWG
ncbi:MAG: DUF3024 domain-containing protein [Alphaproteobacteria bacterium]|nr:DUF3024 domain-containing protein [Alphaproteobacteria bacterium]